MKKSKYVILAAAIAVWIVIFIFAESTIGKMLGLTTVEFWPALLGPSLIGFLGGDKVAEKKFFIMASFGIAASLVFVLLVGGRNHLVWSIQLQMGVEFRYVDVIGIYCRQSVQA